ncbi:MAG: HAMP domain-containing histidine kinase [Chloroflexi bacterium]|nr:HAMP domain-containing histidine kinase [Chloroflexota bacterium]
MASSSGSFTAPAHTLDTAALILVGEGATPAQLAERFGALAAAGRADGAAALMARLASLGLVRVASGEGDRTSYVLTPLGQEYAGDAIGGQTDVVTQLEALERLRTDLLSTIAHELRTPLTAVRASVGLLRDPRVRPDEAAQAQLLDRIARSAERMQRLVSDVLDLARFRSGTLTLQARRFDAVALACEAGTALASLLQAADQHVDLHLPDGPVWVYGDRRRLEQALLNLLSNAQKFSPPGATIGLSVAVDGGDVIWTVEDRGPGIAPEHRARLFERFFTSASDSSGPGAGLGLPISLAIAEAHGGTIQVETEVARGSSFALRVPAHGPAELGEL